MTPAARTVWAKVYPDLSAGLEGLHGAVTARADPQAIRLALIYCLLDGGERIDVPHLMAALAVWDYCNATAKHVFGNSLGDRVADGILHRLGQAGADGMTRTKIRDAFGRNQSAERIGAALELVQRKGHAICALAANGPSRPVETWRVAQ